MTAYYNENDPFAAAWLRNLIAEGLIEKGEVDERSIVDVSAGDLVEYEQCHFFAGIGIWSYALQQAGWPKGKKVWTGSCPCQPFSAAGQRKGFDDARHLWPHWFRLVRESRPESIFGEQVASVLDWLDLVSGDLEGEGYACGAVILGAHSVGAPHIRQRIYWVAESKHHAEKSRRAPIQSTKSDGATNARPYDEFGRCSDSNKLAYSSDPRRSQARQHGSGPSSLPSRLEQCGGDGELGQSAEGRRRPSSRSYWSDCDWLPCIDGKARPVEPGTFPLAHGYPNRVGTLRGYGNALCAPTAIEFIKAYLSL